MELALFIYLADVADGLKNTAVSLSFLVGFLMIISILVCTLSDPENDIEKRVNSLALKGIKWSAPIFVIILALALFIPSRSTLYLMAGGYAAQEVATGEIGSKVLTVINLELDKMIGGKP